MASLFFFLFFSAAPSTFEAVDDNDDGSMLVCFGLGSDNDGGMGPGGISGSIPDTVLQKMTS